MADRFFLVPRRLLKQQGYGYRARAEVAMPWRLERDSSSLRIPAIQLV